jgi:hypothetical protein
MVYPYPLFKRWFNSEQRTAELLRPEVEAGNVTERDFAMATAFYPSMQRYYGVCRSLLAYAHMLSACLVS